jgi:hypothetical protein
LFWDDISVFGAVLTENPFLKKANQKSKARGLMLWHLSELEALNRRLGPNDDIAKPRVEAQIEQARKALAAIG